MRDENKCAQCHCYLCYKSDYCLECQRCNDNDNFVSKYKVKIFSLLICGIGWIITCGIIKLITMCLGFTFNWVLASFIWLGILILIAIIISGGEGCYRKN